MQRIVPLLALPLLLLLGAAPSGAANLLENGSMNGVAGIDSWPDPWTGFSFDLFPPGGYTTIHGVYADGTPASPDGGTFSSIAARPGWAEFLQQNLENLTVGAKYSVSFWATNVGFRSTSGFPDNVKQGVINVHFGDEMQTTDVLVHEGFGSQTWRMVSMTFTATESEQLFRLQAIDTSGQGGTAYARLGVDGVMLAGPPVSVSPESWSGVKALYR